ncbi:MAG: efflux RND transporter permease subunit [Verrucomicrobiales bacterium]|nr:efflux RND transporter permease subunit [Verrucomicrobiales bacterium]
MIRWFARNDIAANFLLVGILLAGIHAAMYRIPLQVSPTENWNNIIIRMEYRGGTAKDVEKAISIPIEEAIRDLPGIARVWAYASRGRGMIWAQMKEGVDQRALLEEVKARIDRINSFPAETENPEIYIPDSDSYREVITIAVTGDLSDTELVRVAETVRDDLMAMESISMAEVKGERPFEISIEADQERLRSYGLSFQDLSNAIQRSSVDLSAGSIQSTSGSLSLRTRGQAYTAEEFAKIPIRAANGADVLLGEVARVIDGFEEGKVLMRFNDEPALMVEVMRFDLESAIEIADQVHEYVDSAQLRFPDGINLYAWDDESIAIKGRLGTLTTSMIQGCLLVFILLALFLRPALAFWVVIGIPISFAGGLLLMPWLGISANLMSVFGFIIVVGLVVDDAIVTGENIYSKLKTGMVPLEASVAGTKEVAVPVTFGVLTTIVAFLPLLYFDGTWGNFAKQIPPVVAPVLLFSLIETKLILPSHLKHLRLDRDRRNPIDRIQSKVANGLERFVERIYRPALKLALNQRYTVCSLFLAGALLMFGYAQGGGLGFVSMPSVDRLRITAYLDLPNDTPLEQTDTYIQRIRNAAEVLKAEFIDTGSGRSLITNVMEEVGDRDGNSLDETRGEVAIEILPPSMREAPGPRNSVIANRWKELVGEIPEAQSFRVRAEQSGFSRRGDTREQEPVEVELRGPSSEEKVALAEEIESLLESFDGISDAYTQVQRGSDELEIALKPRAAELNLTQQELARQIRQAFYGEEAQRLLRGTDDIRVMVRLTQQERESLHTLDTLKIRTPSGADVSLAAVADVQMVKVPSRIERIDGAEVIEIKAIPVDESVDIMGIAASAAPEIQAIVNEGEGLSYRYTGFIAENEESKRRIVIGSIALFFALYGLLAIPFRSLTQPIFVLLAVPFGVIGALVGHMIMGITPSYLSIFGMLALAGVVVNDSLVMVDFINRRREDGMALGQAIIEAGSRRFRPILLTSITTFAGLMPLMFDRSIQGQFLIPMAVSLAYGILFATAITLFLIPCSYQISADLGSILTKAKNWYFRTPAKAGTSGVGEGAG